MEETGTSERSTRLHHVTSGKTALLNRQESQTDLDIPEIDSSIFTLNCVVVEKVAASKIRSRTNFFTGSK